MDDYLLTEEEIDGLRLITENEIGKVASNVWWDWCAAYEKMHGEEAAQGAEQLMIDIINRTSLNACKAQLAKLRAPDDVRERLEQIYAGVFVTVSDSECEKAVIGNLYASSCDDFSRIAHTLYAPLLKAAEQKGRQEERERIAVLLSEGLDDGRWGECGEPYCSYSGHDCYLCWLSRIKPETNGDA